MFLGTGAAEGIPGLWCLCENCEAARKALGKSVRMRTALLINDDLLVDIGHDLLQAACRFGLRLTSVTTVLVTHAHGDHFDINNLNLRAPAYRQQGLPLMTVYGPPQVIAEIEKIRDAAALMVVGKSVGPFQQFDAGRYLAWSFPATHSTQQPLFYAIAEGRKKVLVAFDTGPLAPEAWNGLTEHVFDAVIMEETMGTQPIPSHMGIEDVIAVRQRMEKEGMLAQDCRFFITHMSHHANPLHEELERIMRPHGIEVAHDGLRATI
jgi:phosphoribosyl 1,2-cyclic phosphate phosphodiesterase